MVQEAIDAQWQTKNIIKSRCSSHQSVGRMEQQMEPRWQVHTRSLISYLGYLGVVKSKCIHSHKNHNPAPTSVIHPAVIDEVTEEAVRHLRRPSV